MTAEEYLKEQRQSHFEGYDIEEAFNAGMQEMKQRMMKDAVEAEIYFSYDALRYLLLAEFPKEFRDEAKVKVIIIKEE